MAALVALAAGGFAFSAAAELTPIDFKGVTLYYENAAVDRPDGDDGDIVFKFTDTDNPGTLKLPSYSTAWILSIGGGGAGGTGKQNANSAGVGGGGGAGGFIEKTDQTLSGGTYTIDVGAGGKAGEDGDLSPGENGNPSFIRLKTSDTDGQELTDFTAKGGGGGGAECAGKSGASGGGGSMANSLSQSGGNAIYGNQGTAGGAGEVNKAGAGGGGAGASALNAGTLPRKSKTKANGYGSEGGDGRPSKITLSATAADEDAVYYAGGGGGGVPSGDDKMGFGGKGNGLEGNVEEFGKGGGGLGGKTAPIQGADGFGGGGGGGTHVRGGAKGGDGVVIIRLSVVLPGDPARPTPPEPVPYNGKNRRGMDVSPAYEIGGVACATNAGTYRCWATLYPGFKWSDGTDVVVTNEWTILPREVEVPVGPTLTFTNGNRIAISDPDPALVFVGVGEGNNQTNATNAGNYYYLVELKDSVNYIWKDAEPGQKRIDWTIGPKPIIPPVCFTDLVYNGNYQDAFVQPPEYAGVYSVSDGKSYARDAASYNFTLTLENEDAQNYIWRTEDYGDTYDDQFYTWSIAQTNNAITKLELVGWKVGNKPTKPKVEACWGANTAVFKYAVAEDAAEDQWSPDPPTEAGNYFVWAHVPETANWASADKKLQFTLWDNPEQLFHDYVPIEVTNDSGAERINFALELTFAEDDPNGFSYSRAGANGNALVFISDEGEMLAYEVKNWNISSTSKIIVYVTKIPKDGTSIKMYWYLRDGQVAPAQPPKPEPLDPGSTKVTSEFGIVEHDGRKIDAWDPAPTMDPVIWDGDAPPEEITLNDFALKSGATVQKGYYNIYDPSVTNAFDEILTASNGVYRAVFYNNERSDWEPISYQIQFVVVGHDPTIELGDSASGRVLLMNNDKGGNGLGAITYQGAGDSDASYYIPDSRKGDPYYEESAKRSDTPTFWQFIGDDKYEDTMYNRKAGTNSVLWTKNYGQRLWHLVDCRHGNTYNRGDNAQATGAPTMKNDQNYLPWASSSRRISQYQDYKPSHSAARAMEVGQILMRNTTNAAIYSPCYTNGVGTIYFDAVNGWTDNIDRGDIPGGAYQFVVEVATETKDGTNLTEWTSHTYSGGTTNYYANIKEWKPVKLHPLHYKDGTLTPEPVTTKFTLAVKTGGTKSDFYRFVVPLEENSWLDPLEPLRFRIRRASVDTGLAETPDVRAFILVDNVLVSYPAMTAKLQSDGWRDTGRRGKQTMGWECATTVPFPSLSDIKVFGRAKGEYYTNEGDPTADPRKFVVAAQMHYRWRYLSQHFGDWQTVDLNPVDDHFTAMEPLRLPGEIGDVEYWYETRFQAPFYSYQDYSGTGVGLGGYYTEEKTVLTNHYVKAEGERLESMGDDWFFRLRNGASDYESVQLVLDGALWGTNQMELVSDGMWRALVKVPTNVFGRASFCFWAFSPGAVTPRNLVRTDWGNLGGETELERIPNNGDATENGGNIMFDVDHDANYYEFKFSERYRTWAISRAEYQNFNNWNDAHGPKDVFYANFAESNGVDDVAMTTSTMNAGPWAVFNGANTNWNENFYLRNYKDPGFPRDIVFNDHLTPMKWNGYNLSFVARELYKDQKAYDADVDTESGLAAKLRGMELGVIDFSKADCPQGLEKVQVLARIGQTVSFDSFNYSARDMRKKNYTFLTPAFMSNGEPTDGNTLATMAAGASVSVFAYYRDSIGCYEFRVSRDIKGKNIHGTLYKWYKDNGVMKAKVLREGFFPYILWTDVSPGSTESKLMQSYGLFISAKTISSTSVQICAGFSTEAKEIGMPGADSDAFAKTLNYCGVCYTDSNSELTKGGTYGVAAKDCPAMFTQPRHYDLVTYIAPAADGTFQNKPQVFSKDAAVTDAPDLMDDYWELNGSVDKREFNNLTNYRQIYVPEQDQELELQLQAKPNGNWVSYGKKTVSGYNWKTLTYDLHLTGQWNMRLKTCGPNVDVVVGDIAQTQWQAKDLENIDYRSTEFIYTQGIVQTNVTRKTNEVLLQPGRGLASKSMSVRGPVLHGIGSVAFDYSGVDENAEIWVQVATNRVDTNLTGQNGYNYSVKSVDNGEQAPVGTWVTLEKFNRASLGPSGTKTIYLGWHNQPDRPITGIFRVFVPPAVIERATVAATNATQNVDYGKITITGMTVTDEPGLSDRAWRGWNMRTIGDESDSEKRMYLFDMTRADGSGNGLDCGLNNSINGVDSRDAEKVSSGYPSIYSPTMRSTTGSSGVGSVTFKARLYGEGAETAEGGVVTLFAAKSSVGATAWTKVAEIRIDSSVFRDYSWVSSNASYAAVKFEIHNPAAKTKTGTTDRIILDEVVIGERVEPSLGFLYARPFRMNLLSYEPIDDILTVNEQPLVGENWGVQTQLSLQQLSDEIDLERGFEVYLSYFTGKSPWGYGQWKSDPAAVKRVKLTQVGDPTNLVFRSVGETPDTLVRPVTEGGTVVQYQLTVKFYDRGGTAYERTMDTASDWRQPDWFYPIDLNRDNGGYADAAKFSPYTVLDTVSPGRAWINEVNWNDGSAADTGTSTAVNTNQFIEICVPSGVDMTGWYLRATGINDERWTLAVFGVQMPAQKVSVYGTNDFEFVVVESPATQAAGSVRAPEDPQMIAADGTWSADGPGPTDGGSFSYCNPYQLELVRPSGIIEHQFVMQGTNEWASYPMIGYLYDGTNLLAKLNEKDSSPIRFYAGEEQAWRRDGLAFGSTGVVGGEADGAPAPGANGTWRERLRFTPGRLNEGQIIPEGWYLPPNGTNSWVTLTVVGSHLRQDVGGETNQVMKLVIPQGSKTNITYTADAWYELATLTVNGQTNAQHEARNRQAFNYELSPTGQVCNVIAREGADVGLEDFGLRGHPYAPAVTRWLSANWPDKTSADIRLAAWKDGTCEPEPLDLVEMYWLDIPPFAETDAELDFVAAGGTNWWLCSGITDWSPNSVTRIRHYEAGDIKFINSQIDIYLYISNAVDSTQVYAPKYLQGINNERSDTYPGQWVSETFQMLGALNNGQPLNMGYLPFRSFVFNAYSFSGPYAEKPFTAKIEILDPFSTESPGYSYGWHEYPRTSPFFFKWTLSTNAPPYTIQTLKQNDTYGD